MGDQRFRFEILGTPGMFWRDQTYKLSRRQARALLFYLANTLQPISRQQLCFLLWPDIPDSKARRNLSRLLSFLRAQLPTPELLFSSSEMVSLNSKKVSSDAVEFVRFTAQRLPEAKQAAVDLYRGDFMKGFSISKSPEYERWISAARSQYESLYLSTLAELIKVKHAARDLASAIHYAQVYLAVDELAEEIHRILISLYAESGDQVAAMRQFEACTLILERELGVEPLPETRAAYEAIRSDTRQPAPQQKIQPTWTILPSLDLPLIGRQAAWKDLENAYRRLQSGGVIFIRGKAGIGKSRLLQEFATRGNRVVLSGNCHASTQTLPYQPLTQALRQAFSQPRLWSGIRPIWLSEAGRLLPEMGDFYPDLPAPIDVAPEQAQARLYEALAQCALGIAANARILLCLDDLQWIDEATLGWLTYISSRLAGSGMCILATYRTAGESVLSDLRESLKRSQLVAEVSLSGLSQEAILEILAQLPDPPPQPFDLAIRIKNATGGNPFFVLETLRIMLENDQLAAPPKMLPLAETVQEAILRRLDNLSPVARQVLEVAAVLALDLNLPLLQGTAGRAEFEIVDGLDELVRRQMLIEGEPPRLSHDLIAQAIYQNLNPWRRRLLHRRAAESLIELYKSQTEDVAAQVAEHYDAAGVYEKAIEFYRLAADAARQLYAHQEAIVYLQRAIELAPNVSRYQEILPRLYEALADILSNAGRFAEAEAAFRTILDFDPVIKPFHAAELRRKLAATLTPQQRGDEAEIIYMDALDHLEGQPPKGTAVQWRSARLNILLGLLDALYFQNKPEKMAELNDDTRILLDQVGTAEQRVHYYARLNQVAFLDNCFIVPAENIVLAQEALAHAQQTDDLDLIARALFHLGFHQLWHGNLVESEGALQQAFQMAKDIGNGWLENQCLVYLSIMYRLKGDITQVTVFGSQLVDISQRIGNKMYIGVGQANLAWLHYLAEEWDQAREQAEGAMANWSGTFYPFQWLAAWLLLLIALRRDRIDEAVNTARAMLEPDQQRLPDKITAALERSVSNWEAGNLAATRDALQEAVGLARKRGYL